MRRTRCGAIAAAVAIATAGGGEAVAQTATWDPPQRVAVEQAAQFSSLRMAIGPDGRGLLVWASRRPEYAIHAVDVAADGTLGPRMRVSPPGDRASGPQVGVGRDGEAVVGWRSGRAADRQVRVAVRGAGASSFSAPSRLSPPRGRNLLTGLDVAPDGRAVAAWVRRTGTGWRVQIAQRPPGAPFGTAQTISGNGAVAATVALGGDASALVAWTRATTLGRTVVETLPIAADGALGVSLRLSPPGDGLAPRVAIDQAGAAVIAWLQLPGGGAQELRAVVRPTSGAAFGAQHVLASTADPRGGFSEAEVAIDRGRAHATFADFGMNPTSVWVASTNAVGAWSAGKRVSAGGSAAFAPEVRAAGDRVVAVWQDTPQEGARSGHLAAAVAEAGAWSAPQTISDPSLILQSGTSPRLAIAPDGTALVAYVDYGFDEGSGRGQLSIVRLPA